MLVELGRMHDTDAMAAIQATRESSLVHTSVIKQPFKMVTKEPERTQTVIQTYQHNIIDDDDFSDHDSHYSEDFLDDDFEDPLMEPQPPDVTKRLLGFAEMVNIDIQKYFGRKKDEDSCDVYEDKWIATKSGRELYYADLVKIAQGESVDSRKTSDGEDNKRKYTGKMDTRMGLGPLNELFDYGLRHYLTEQKQKSKKNVKRLKQQDIKKLDEVVPMTKRKLPDSFWNEPGCQKQNDRRVNGALLQTSQPPDFSDLLHNWTTAIGEDEFSGEMSSDMSVGSSESL